MLEPWGFVLTACNALYPDIQLADPFTSFMVVLLKFHLSERPILHKEDSFYPPIQLYFLLGLVANCYMFICFFFNIFFPLPLDCKLHENRDFLNLFFMSNILDNALHTIGAQ